MKIKNKLGLACETITTIKDFTIFQSPLLVTTKVVFSCSD